MRPVAQDIAGNFTRVYWWYGIEKSSSAYAIYGGSGIFIASIDGTVVLNRSIAFSMSASQTEIGFADGYLDIPHNNDGTKSFGVSFSFTPQTSAAYFPGSMSGSGTFTCTPIARATTPTLSKTSLNLGTAVTITATPAVNTFTHKLYYQIGTGTPTLLSSLAAGTQSYSWTVPLSLANSFTSSKTGTVVVVCETYSDTTLIGTSNVNLTVTVPTSAKPTISSVTISEAVTNPNIASQFGAYIQNRSKLRVVTAATAQYGATIQGCTVAVGDETYSGTTVVTNELRSSGSVSVTVTVTDSRGYSTTSTQTVNVVAYNPPTITVAEAVRCDSSGTPDDNGEYVRFTYSYNITNIGTANKNNPSFVISRYDGSAWETLYTKTNYTASNTVSYSTSFTFDIQTEYKVRFMISDFFTTSTGTQTVVIKEVHPSFVLLDFGAGGNSVAIGQLSSDDGSLEAALPFRPYGGIHSYIAGVGTTNGAWVKVFSIRIVKRYSYGYFAFSVLQEAGARSGCRVELQIAGGNIDAQNISTFYIDNRLYLGLVRAYKSDTDTFDIYVKKSGNARIVIYSLEYSTGEAAQVIPEFIDEEASLPSGAVTPVWYGMHAFPIGATFESTSNANPGNNFGGTWTQIQTQETLTVSGSKVVSASSGQAQMHTMSQIKALFNEKYGFTPTFSATMSSAQASADNGTVGDAYLDLGIVYYNGDLNANGGLLGAGRGTDSNETFYVLSTTNGGVRVNYTYITHRTMYRWTRTA